MRPAALLLLLGAASLGAAPPSLPPWASDKPLPEPTLFAPGEISTGESESHAAFTPDGKTVYFIKSDARFTFWTIVVSRFENGHWTRPEVAPFSGRYRDADPFLTPDGSKLYFLSDRPVDGTPKEDLDLWVVERKGDGWGAPRNLGAPVNSPGNEWFPTVTANGTLYFGSDRPGGKGRTDLYRARFVDGRYAEPENLGDAINSQYEEFEPMVAPDESFLIFMAARPGGQGGGDLWLSTFRDGAWTPAKNPGAPVNSPATEIAPRLTPDGRYLFFASSRGFFDQPLAERLDYGALSRKLNAPGNGLGDVYRIDVGALGLTPPAGTAPSAAAIPYSP
ncbi:MAG TPA: hypothetical protein VGG03_28075 [Thermoanaerobaculia bacterium]